MSLITIEMPYRVTADGVTTHHTSFREALVTATLSEWSMVTPPSPPDWFVECASYVVSRQYAPVLIYALGNQGCADHFGMAKRALEYSPVDETRFNLPEGFEDRAVFFIRDADRRGQIVKDGLPDLCCDLILGGVYDEDATRRFEIELPNDLAELQWTWLVRSLRQYNDDPLSGKFVRFVSTITDNPLISMIDAMRDLVLR